MYNQLSIDCDLPDEYNSYVIDLVSWEELTCVGIRLITNQVMINLTYYISMYD